MASLPPAACFAAEPLELASRAARASSRSARADDGFAFDCERPRHRVLLHPPRARQPPGHQRRMARVHRRRRLSRRRPCGCRDGWAWVQREGIAAPLYWHDDGTRVHAWPGGARSIAAAPVAHVSYYEADAFARWAGARLPTEAEWEELRRVRRSRCSATSSTSAAPVAPRPAAASSATSGNGPQSAFSPYPGFAPAEGAVGEYNGKFMCGQLVLKGASCATPRGHSRASYRNFFPPARAGNSRGSALLATLDEQTAAFRADVLAGLAAPIPAIPARWLYDRRGSELFDEITRLADLLSDAHRDRAACTQIMPEIAARVPKRRGGGRIRRRLGDQDADPARGDHARGLCPGRHLRRLSERSAARACSADFPAIDGHSGRGRFRAAVRASRTRSRDLPKLGFFPGSTIGNFVPRSATDLLRQFPRPARRRRAAADRHGPGQAGRAPDRRL